MVFMTPQMRRELKQRQSQVENLGTHAEGLAERHFFKRMDRLVMVRRFVIGWVLFFVLISGSLVGQIRALNSYYQSMKPVNGGIYTEGVVGDFTNANPLFVTSDVDESISKLLFSGLFTYDKKNRLVGDLATGFTLDESGKIYTVNLRPDLFWHDGVRLTSRDVLFTYEMAQNPDALSSLNQSWRGVKVTAVDDLTVKFTLQNSLSSFPYHMTNGLIPEHLLKDVPPKDLRSSQFNTLRPIGSGPFMWDKLEILGNSPENREIQVAFKPYEKYHHGAPKLGAFVVHSFQNEESMTASFQNNELTAASFSEVPEVLVNDTSRIENNFILTAANMVFFRQGAPVMGDPAVRKALVQSVDVKTIVSSLDYQTRPVQAPLLRNQIGYDPKLTQLPFNPEAAIASLETGGWKQGKNGIRAKGQQQLRFKLYGADTRENRMVTAKLQNDWKKSGINASVELLGGSELQKVIASSSYDALLYGISNGVDPDVFVYWHSSQNDPRSNRLNFSEYQSKVADEALEGGRTRTDSSLRTVKYRPFLQSWQQDAPALGLYQPRYAYITRGEVYGLRPGTINQDTDRFNFVHTWQIRQAMVTNEKEPSLN